ncbi:low molecular weight phosphotyrosine protein phosphatase [Reyranella sp. MMS21-HV4-11]|jgi:protein-tyrosine phosphatase|uniref:protein-tyrosine-phosphatase n=1 Tax=Reyranella humidisoli TaxID=2849149 RepID=A0ABS6ILR5_9HYPH|nr:low molecular weight protein-tyrosine-phosphatase [Reyranella sp. MMS21-HV4-11]MBU8874140.1 low molecular weight phosphotyrosine protein phosphatase [Reyranella sp. MMS21-HV4-11]
MTIGILFVCTANLCRSPTAEGVFRSLVTKAGLAEAFEIDSAGTGASHVGQPPTPAAIDAAAARGYDITGIRARQITSEDIERFDYVLGMTRGHLAEMRWLAPRDFADKPQLLMNYAPPLGILDIPDPFGGTTDDYERAIGLIESATRGLLARLTPQVKRAI